jgi:hypothetical protein
LRLPLSDLSRYQDSTVLSDGLQHSACDNVSSPTSLLRTYRALIF